MKPIYLDYAAATPIDTRVLEAMQPYFTQQFYNPSSPYLAARQVKTTLEDARHRVAQVLGAKTTEIIFTAGATESINLAIHGLLGKFPDAEVLTLAIEHDAVLASARLHSHKIVPVLPTGAVDLNELEKAITDKTLLVSIGYANNEIGTIQPIKDTAYLIERVRADRKTRGVLLPIYLHTDASQVGAYLDLHVSRLGVDLLTLNAGKLYGPKQMGILFVKTGIELTAQITGGGQERNLRSGTESVTGVIGLATALEIAQAERKTEGQRQSVLRDKLQKLICDAWPGTQVNGNQKKRLPNSLHVSWENIDGERLVMLLDERGVMASTGSACAANKNTASHVLPAIGLSPAMVGGSLRLTLGRFTTEEEIAKAAKIIIQSVQELQQSAQNNL